MRKVNILILCFFIFKACTVQYVAAYDEKILEEIVNLSERVDRFYMSLFEFNESDRIFEKYKTQYSEIEINIRSLLLKNEIRPLNSESIQQTKNLLALWIDDKEQHKKLNTVNDFIINLHRDQFRRMFVAIARGEEAKKE